MYVRCAALLHAQHGLLTRRQLLDSGMDERELRRLTGQGALLTVRRGVYVERDRWEALDPYRDRPLLRIRAARMTLGGDYVLSHDSAALVHGLGVPDATRALVHVTRTKVHGDAVRAGVKHHLAPYSPAQVVVIDGLPVLDLARTALDMAREHGQVAGLACCDRALRLGVSRAELEEERRRMWCWPFSTVMAEAVSLADAGAESWLESEARLLVIGLGLGRPETQFGLTDGHRTAYGDMRVGRHLFEVDGALKYDEDNSRGLTPREVLLEEKKRQDFLTGFKLGISRITAHDCRAGRRAAEVRILREHADTCARFGTVIADLAPYIVRRPR